MFTLTHPTYKEKFRHVSTTFTIIVKGRCARSIIVTAPGANRISKSRSPIRIGKVIGVEVLSVAFGATRIGACLLEMVRSKFRN
jgi:hypothetical protein